MRLLPESFAPKPPTDFQRALLLRIDTLTKGMGKPPSLVEVATDRQNLERLRIRGWVSWSPEEHRSLRVTEAGQKWLPGGAS